VLGNRFSRRDLLRFGALAAVLGPVALAADLPLLGLNATPLAKATFSPLIGKAFQLAKGAQRIDARLIGLIPMDPAKSGGEAFKLVFESTSGPLLGQDTYQVGGPQLGRLDLFLVPGASGSGFQHYEALINRLP
jgi:hypothetical protein